MNSYEDHFIATTVKQKDTITQADIDLIEKYYKWFREVDADHVMDVQEELRKMHFLKLPPRLAEIKEEIEGYLYDEAHAE